MTLLPWGNPPQPLGLAMQLVPLLQGNAAYRAGCLGVGSLKGGGGLGHFPPDTVPWWFSFKACFLWAFYGLVFP